LEKLFLTSNQLTEIIVDSGFSQLVTLLVSRNQLNDWNSVNALNHLPNIRELRFQHNPIVEKLPSGSSRIQLIARIGTLMVLNGTPINAQERLDAERYYLRRIEMDLMEREQVEKLHPRYAVLVAQHGDVGRPDGSSRQSRQYKLTLRGPEKELNRNVAANTTVKQLKQLCQQLFGIGVSNQKLLLQQAATDRNDIVYPELLSDDNAVLADLIPFEAAALVLVESLS
jgi:Leucine-rich repeat (LRR) protein